MRCALAQTTLRPDLAAAKGYQGALKQSTLLALTQFVASVIELRQISNPGG
jgi:hypothetical protein